MVEDTPLWRQFRRLLLGAVVESLLGHHIAVEFGSITIRFEDTSAFRVPRLDNYMRFAGTVTARLAGAPPPGAVGALEGALRGLWPELLGVVELPVGDRLTSSHMHLVVTEAEGLLTVRFDLEAD